MIKVGAATTVAPYAGLPRDLDAGRLMIVAAHGRIAANPNLPVTDLNGLREARRRFADPNGQKSSLSTGQYPGDASGISR